MPIRYVHLRVHSEYSLRDSTIRIPEKPEYGDPAKASHANLVSRAVELGLPALALTDDSNLFAQIKFYRAAEKAGIKPIVGCDVWLVNPEDPTRPDRLTLLCRDHDGYLNLTRLVSRGWLEGQRAGRAQLQPAWLEGAVGGLFAVAGRDGACGRLLAARREHDAQASLIALRRHFGDGLYLELTRTRREGEDAFNARALQWATRFDLPVIASNDVRFLDAGDFEAHEARVCIQQGYQLADARRPHDYSPEQWLKPADAMAKQFADLPEALENTVELARRCNLELSFGKYYLPAFPTPRGETLDTWIGDLARRGLEERLAEFGLASGHAREDYDARLEHELDTIVKMGFPGYFLIVSDFIRWAKDQDIPVGPGRGSGAGSVVAWSLGITDLDPLRFNLLFERFLNPERVSMPDFDVDFCMERRDEVIAYVAQKYGRDQVSQIITYGSMAAKAVLRDCGRVLGMPYGQVDKLAKLIPRMPLDLTLSDALGQSEKSKQDPDRVVREFCAAYQQDDEARTLIDLALKLEGLARNAGKHAGGVVIAPTPLTDFSPLYSEPGGSGVVTQYDKNDVEAVGLVKFDFLGLRTLTIIDWAVKAINARRSAARGPDPHPASGHHGVPGQGRRLYPQGEGKNEQPAAATTPLDIATIPLDDPEVFRMFREARTVAVFQFEGGGMQRLLKDAKPDRFEDLIALNALFRPGPMELIPNYVARKRGREPVTYPDPRVEPVLKETYGIMVYQEQVMQMAQIVGGYSLGGADLLRRAMGKKNPVEMAKQREVFHDGAMQNGVPGKKADAIFDQMEKFAGYGFNKSHAAAYTLVAYQTAWLKTHHPAEFMAATMSSDMDSTDKLVQFIDDAKAIGLAVLPPDVNASDYHFVAIPGSGKDAHDAIRYGLGAIKGVGRAVCEAVMAERASGKPFRDLADFCARMGSGKLNKRVFEALIQSGALDALGRNRATLAAQLPEAVKAAEQSLRDREAGQNDMFGAALAPVASVALTTPAQAPWTLERKLAGERATLGHYLSGHPTDPWRHVLTQLTTCPIGEIAQRYEPPPPRGNSDGDENRFRRAPETPWTVAGMVVRVFRHGESGAGVRIEDWSGAMTTNFFRDAMEQYGALVQPDAILVIEGGLAFDDFRGELRVRARRVWTLDAACEAGARVLRIGVNGIDAGFVGTFKRALAGHCGGHTPLLLAGYHNGAGRADLRLGDDWRVRVDTELLRSLAAVPGVKSVEPLLSRPGP